MKTSFFLFAIIILASCQNQIRQEVNSRSSTPITSLRDYGRLRNQGVINDAQRIENKTALAELEKDLEKQNIALNTVVQQMAVTARTHLFLGLKQKEAGMFADAVASFTKAIERNALNARLYYEAGICQAQVALTLSNEQAEMSARNEALRFLEKSVGLDNQDPDSLFALATMYSHFYNRFEEADKVLAQYTQIMPALPVEALFLQGFIAAGLGQNQRAASFYDQIARMSNLEASIREQAAQNRNQMLSRVKG